ncbi:hypothetical protein D0T84_10145 [Dysgonomonas sp. 521]|uniref:GxGYxYP domain-containing protein n=1 Tax=Dysgonomonas sp. 521 TaxID=2302932 RepID=UPI0013D0DA53|nr:GxGYxYP domain-containing protein [Dysgonomonas sp. 521]NDV95279.1 hypothetical protein [Dysgonomonas sp. 521]
MKIPKIIIVIALVLLPNILAAWEYDGRYGWPEQKAPKKLIHCKPASNVAEAMLLESLSGLAAQAVNEGKFDEMVWIDIDNLSYKYIYDNSIKTLQIKSVTNMDIWGLLDYLKKKKVIKGYVLYKLDKQRPNAYSSYPDIDYSSNVATVYASLLKGVLIDESLADEAKKHGLKQLKDARYENPIECFNKNKNKLNNSSALSIPPTVTNLRDYAIAHKLMLYADKKEIINPVLEWVKPLSPILGWGCGDEYDFTSLIAEWGHYNSATNWCWNLPFITSVGEKAPLKKANEISPNQINYNDKSSFHTFVMSDGDNMQWTMGKFLETPLYLGNQNRDKVGLTWTLCPINLSVVSPFTWNSIAEVQTHKFSYLEYGGGYQYPDLFASKRPNRLELVREFAKRINYHLKKLDIKIFGFICRDVSGQDAQDAFQIYAEEMEDITGMLAVQYFPYELDGEIYWKKNRRGIDIPVVTSRYSIWDEVNKHRPRAGTPEFIASLINRDVTAAKENKEKSENSLSWTIVHAWSNFSKSSKVVEKPAVGFNPVETASKMLIDDIKTVSANELLWRIRMKYRTEQTRALLDK